MTESLHEPFVNNIGQKIYKGDRVVAVTQSTGTVRTHVGIYDGRNSSGGVRLIEVPKRSFKRDPETGKWGWTEFMGKLSLQRNRVYKVAE